MGDLPPRLVTRDSDKAMLERRQTLEALPSVDRERILFVFNSLMGDTKTCQAHQSHA